MFNSVGPLSLWQPLIHSTVHEVDQRLHGGEGSSDLLYAFSAGGEGLIGQGVHYHKALLLQELNSWVIHRIALRYCF